MTPYSPQTQGVRSWHHPPTHIPPLWLSSCSPETTLQETGRSWADPRQVLSHGLAAKTHDPPKSSCSQLSKGQKDQSNYALPYWKLSVCCLLSIKTSPGFLGCHVRLFASGPNPGLILAVTPALCSLATLHAGLQGAVEHKEVSGLGTMCSTWPPPALLFLPSSRLRPSR